MAVTIYEIAKRAGVSSSTVARAVRGNVVYRSKRSAERAKQVQRIAQEMGYQRNWRAKVFSNRKTHAVGLFHTDPAWICEDTMGEIAGSFAIAMRDRGYHVVIVPYDTKGQWHEFLKDGRLDGLAVSHSIPRDAIEVLEESCLPRVLIGDKSDGTISDVVSDDEGGAYTATRHFITLGHRRIVMYVDPEIRPHFSVGERRMGYETAVREAGLQPEFYQIPEERLVHELVRPADRPTAVLCYCHVEARKLYHAMWQQGLRIPGDVSVIAFNELPSSKYMTPPLSTMGFDTRLIGLNAAELLVENIENPSAKPRHIMIPQRLITRSSAAALA